MSMFAVFLCSALALNAVSALRMNLRMQSDVLQWLQSYDKDTTLRWKLQDGQAIATAPIKKGELLISIPQGLTLDAAKATVRFGAQLGSITLKTGDVGLIALLLLAEKNSKDSKWSAYLASLPASPPGVLSWSEADLKELESCTTRNVAAQLSSVTTDFDTLSRTRTPLLPPGTLTLETFRWAVGITKSRLLYIDNKPCLAPGVDCLAMDPFATAEPFASSAGFFGGKVIKLLADRAYQPGDPLYMSFGLKSSAECLEDHGTVPLLDLADACAELSVGIEDTDRFPDDKTNVLENAGYPSRMRFDLEAEVGLDAALLQFLRLKFIEGRDAFILEACFSDSVWSTLSLPFSKVNELKVFTYLRDTCASLLSRLTREPSVAVGEERRALLAELREQERAALEGSLTILEAEVRLLEGNGLDTREYYQERRLRELNLLRPLDESEIVMPGDRAPLDGDDY